jgi:hypothetical protein
LTDPIKVTAQFKRDFDEYCAIMEFDRNEIAFMRDEVRKKFDTVGEFISTNMKVHRWMRGKWGYMPTYDHLLRFLYSRRIFIDEKIYGFYALARFCWEIAESEKSIQASDTPEIQ